MNCMSKIYILFFIIFSALSCQKKTEIILEKPAEIPMVRQYEYLPENLIAENNTQQTTARYTDPTTRYGHGILGDKIEAGGLLVTRKGKDYYVKLDSTYVFEDLQPRLADVDNDGELEFITIQSSLTQGGSVAVYKILDEKLQLFVASNFIGTSSRWLNIAAIDDLDNDGKVEIAWVQTPHIGGILRIAHIENGKLIVLDEKSGVSNHRIGSKNLCLSVLTQVANAKTLYLPTNAYDALLGFQFKDKKIVETDKITAVIEASKSLFEQYNFSNRLVDKNCINVR